MIIKVAESLGLYFATLYRENSWMSKALNENFLKNGVTLENTVTIKNQKGCSVF